VILGDNGLIERTAVAIDPRFAVLQGTLIYDADGLALIDGGVSGSNPAGVEPRRIVLFDHDDGAANGGNFGNDYIAGGADDDIIFGQLGDDTIQGDGSIVGFVGGGAPVGAIRDAGQLDELLAPSFDALTDGDDYIEGNGGSDVIFGNLGQDDIVGGSSELYSLVTPDMRPDGSDIIFGGSGTRIGRNEFVGSDFGANDDDDQIALADRHSRDADTILGDNGNIFRLVGIDGTDGGALLEFNYDQTTLFEDRGTERIVVRAADLLDPRRVRRRHDLRDGRKRPALRRQRRRRPDRRLRLRLVLRRLGTGRRDRRRRPDLHQPQRRDARLRGAALRHRGAGGRQRGDQHAGQDPGRDDPPRRPAEEGGQPDALRAG
jgi:hypothetical protein